MTAIVLPLADPAADLALVGGKGASLARLAAAGLPVPAGFHLTTAAYQAFVAQNTLWAPIIASVTGEPDAAAQRISRLFMQADVPPQIAAAVLAAYDRLGGGPVAVRSSATAEDLPEASFAGQQDSFLDVHGGPAVIEAVRACWASLWTARAIAYRARHGISPAEVDLAVVVQRMVPADVAGVLFTADPVTGSADRIVINAVLGLGESLVSGTADPQVIVLDRDGDAIVERHGRQWLDDATARELAWIGRRIERLFARSVDVEWAVHAGEVAVLQARPITVTGHEEWNDSLAGDYLWTCANLGEAIPSVMTPATWSLVQIFMSEAMSVPALGPHPICGRIGGRFYLNLSVAWGAGSALGLGGLVRRASEQAFGRIPSQLAIPKLPMSRIRMLAELVPTVARFLLRVASYQRDLPGRIAGSPQRCERARARIADATTPGELARLWPVELEPLLRDTSRMLAAGARLDGAGLVRVRPWLLRRVDEGDTNALLSGMHTDTGPLASLGPVVGLDRLAHGEIDRAEFLRQWGHRCPDEFEISVPRPAEDPAWVDRELAGLRTAPTDVPALLARQRLARTAALERFRTRHPRQLAALRRRMAGAAKGARGREAARSE
ncbi:MAG TPA: PEP/pyruvate-binding domain-containing protein, partial [Kineosporiaceae bacterium]|nr:PEP/pyruvate-binding domain-containing protein [Kineosporiaceae bacterium]